ncbi:ABC transporter ATP-binding protein [Nitratireductor soli]|uniref:ABC transporter ATP-binding protein n=1 Tax=Nitratireductor soli TaxID=1670619 RepID=UPI00065E50B7|nr:ABC transporter ATP-binding protein [Nitratireductor soli]
MNHLLEIKDLSVAYGDVQALWDVSAHVDEGTVVSVVGANGAGKSTLMRAISGLLEPLSGDILFRGETLVGVPAQEITARGISHVPEGRGLFTQLTVQENLELGAYLAHVRPHFAASLDHVFTLFPKLKERRGQKAGSLSGGEQQMLAIGRALIARPKLLILDEPSLGLSPLVVRQMFELIARLHDEGVTLLLVEQNIRQALKAADRAYVLQTGHVAMQGEAAALLENPQVQKTYMGALD